MDDPALTADEAGDLAATATVSPPPGTHPRDPALARQRGSEALAPATAPHRISPLSLGVGMALMGLGIGFLGVRIRRH
ncbi:hypothetical protein ACFVIM_05220 [Streptomyces sp. NPDC057638]|uniref:hypothetical protein n=1 Tax=Streptomyces sp. NPDC057638 TaxID=3346190 RepID=UPI0036AB54D4